jgi:hypothetical protein
MNNKKQIRPIRFSRLEVGSTFDIFAEPSRGIRKSSDKTVWLKEAESYSVDTTNPERYAILYPEDLVRPLSRPDTRSK